ncbi:MAG: hypothetical protein ABSD77_03845 [Verrucomicrobiota bacterium]|jgi:hypothetical protein
MPRKLTSDTNAEKAVQAFTARTAATSRNLSHAWLTIAELLMTCEVWNSGKWKRFREQLVLRESNDYKINKDGPSQALKEAVLMGDYLASKLGVERNSLCSSIGGFLKGLKIQPNNPRGHAFRSLIANVLAIYGDSTLTVEEEVNPYPLFPGFIFNLRSANPRIDIVISRNKQIVALCSTRWSYRHDRVDILEEAHAYMAAARRVNPNCKFFGITAEVNPARLKKVVKSSAPCQRNAAVERLVHLHCPLVTTVIGHNGELKHLMDLTEWVEDSKNWH